MKTNFLKIREFNTSVNSLVKRNPEVLNTKFGYALKRLSEREIKKAVMEYQKAHSQLYFDNVEQVEIDNALTDKNTGAVLKAEPNSDQRYQYDKEGLKKVLVAQRKFADVDATQLLEEWDNKEFEVTPFFCDEIPEDLTQVERESFTGFAIKEVLPE